MLSCHIPHTLAVQDTRVFNVTQDDKKKAVARAALEFVKPGSIIGVGTGSTANFFVDALEGFSNRIEGTIASSEATADRLKSKGLPVYELNDVDAISVYVDGADEVNHHRQLIKGGGGALTREKIVAAASQRFVCIVDESKMVDALGSFPLPVEVIPMARSFVARTIVALGGTPTWREGYVTDNGNYILDVHDLSITEPIKLESELNQVAGVVANGLFAKRGADTVLVGTDDGVRTLA